MKNIVTAANRGFRVLVVMKNHLTATASNRKFLQEAVFQRWVQGLDTGRIDMRPVVEQHPYFYLIMVKMETDKAVFLENIIIENVLSELIERYGKGFVTVHDSKSLLGLVTPPEGTRIAQLVGELRSQLTCD